jgi:acrylyl-CoA reductase (NADPH)/3-hydroxypropionyl-CoA dehydratase/3-hydroxypropionyl-CoA synthetase
LVSPGAQFPTTVSAVGEPPKVSAALLDWKATAASSSCRSPVFVSETVSRPVSPVAAVVSIEGLERREEEFEWPETLPEFPHPQADPEAFKRAVQAYTDGAFKPLGKAVGEHLRTPENPRGHPDVVFDRAGHDALGVSTMLVRPHTGRVVYSESLEGRRYSFYAPQVWMRQREIHMPTASILGSHLSNAYEIQQLNAEIDAGALDVTPPLVVEWADLPEAHQAMWDNEHEAEAYVVDHALPAEGLRNRSELYKAWGRPDRE